MTAPNTQTAKDYTAAELVRLSTELANAKSEKAQELQTAEDGTKYSKEGSKVTLHPELRKKPVRIEQNPTFNDAKSFAAYLNKYKNENTILFADVSALSVTAIIDYHGKDAPEWNKHKATLSLQHTPEFKAWKAKNGVGLEQREFADFIQDWSYTILDPVSAELYEMISDLRVLRNANFVGMSNSRTGDFKIEYENTGKITTASGKNTLEGKGTLTISVAPFIGGEAVNIMGNIRVEMPELSASDSHVSAKSKLKFVVSLIQLESIINKFFMERSKDIENDTGINILWGKP